MTEMTPKQFAEAVVRGLHENWKLQMKLREGGSGRKNSPAVKRNARSTRSRKTRVAKA